MGGRRVREAGVEGREEDLLMGGRGGRQAWGVALLVLNLRSARGEAVEDLLVRKVRVGGRQCSRRGEQEAGVGGRKPAWLGANVCWHEPQPTHPPPFVQDCPDMSDSYFTP